VIERGVVEAERRFRLRFRALTHVALCEGGQILLIAVDIHDGVGLTTVLGCPAGEDVGSGLACRRVGKLRHGVIWKP
jgi:hypothetical protein